MKPYYLGFLLGLAVSMGLWLSGCARTEALVVTPETGGEACDCSQAGASEVGTFRDRTPSASRWWLPDEDRVPFEILGAHDQRLISAVPFSRFDEYPILLRVGARAQRSGDSRTLGYFSEEIYNPGKKESQALYGINLYSGSSSVSQLGVHGMAQSRPGAGHVISTIVGSQGAASHMDEKGGLTKNVIGTSGVGQTGANAQVNGTIHNLIGVHGHSQSRSATQVNQAISIYGKAPMISGSGSVGLAAAGRFDQPAGASNENHAILVSGVHDRLSIGFLPAARNEAARSISWNQNSEAFEFSHGVGLPVHTTADRPAPGVPGKLIFNADHRNINIDTGAGWILPDGSPAN